jgi:hypothetical protein
LPFPAQPASPPGGAEPAAVMAATVAARLQHVYDGQERGGEEGNVARMAEVSATRGSRRLEETFAPPRPWRRREVRAGGAAKRSSAGAAATMAVSGSNTVFVRNLPFDASDQQARATVQSAWAWPFARHATRDLCQRSRRLARRRACVDKQLEALFADAGPVRKCFIVKDKGAPTVCARVERRPHNRAAALFSDAAGPAPTVNFTRVCRRWRRQPRLWLRPIVRGACYAVRPLVGHPRLTPSIVCALAQCASGGRAACSTAEARRFVLRAQTQRGAGEPAAAVQKPQRCAQQFCTSAPSLLLRSLSTHAPLARAQGANATRRLRPKQTRRMSRAHALLDLQ